MFAININKKAFKRLQVLNQKQKQSIEQVIGILKNDPIPFKKADVCKLRGYNNTYRVRIGNNRIVYQVLWNEKTILIQYIGPRERAYE